jgi:cytidyltransferase-like protein
MQRPTGTLGLTLGKYAPLHAGHQLVIETALAEVERLIVLIYPCPDLTPIPLGVRAEWIRQLYPQTTVIEAWDGPTEVGDTPEIKRRHETYIIEGLNITGITHFFCSEFYGEHMSHALGAANRLVDPGRARVPISATQIRQNPAAYRRLVHPLVYRDLLAYAASPRR